MNGYVRNKTPFWRHAMKRSVAPGQKINLDELFEQYGKKHDLKPGPEFAEWLRSVKLQDMSIWEVVYESDAPTAVSPEPVVEEIKEKIKKEKKPTKPRLAKEKLLTQPDDNVVRPFIKKELQPSDITGMSVRDARAELKKITDINLLKYAYQEAHQLAGKDSLCILLRRRISELEITRR